MAAKDGPCPIREAVKMGFNIDFNDESMDMDTLDEEFELKLRNEDVHFEVDKMLERVQKELDDHEDDADFFDFSTDMTSGNNEAETNLGFHVSKEEISDGLEEEFRLLKYPSLSPMKEIVRKLSNNPSRTRRSSSSSKTERKDYDSLSQGLIQLPLLRPGPASKRGIQNGQDSSSSSVQPLPKRLKTSNLEQDLAKCLKPIQKDGAATSSTPGTSKISKPPSQSEVEIPIKSNNNLDNGTATVTPSPCSIAPPKPTASIHNHNSHEKKINQDPSPSTAQSKVSNGLDSITSPISNDFISIPFGKDKVVPPQTDTVFKTPFVVKPKPPPMPGLLNINPPKIVHLIRPIFRKSDQLKPTSSTPKINLIQIQPSSTPQIRPTARIVSYKKVLPAPKRNAPLGSALACEFCIETFPCYDDNLFRKHLLMKHDFQIEEHAYYDKRRIVPESLKESPYHGCGICGGVFSARYELKRHIETAHEKYNSKIIIHPDFRCGQCMKKFASSFELTSHCTKCSDQYPCPLTVYNLAKTYLNCEICGVAHTDFQEVSMCYINKNILRCAICFDTFKLKDTFFKHLKAYHGLQLNGHPKLTLACPFCTGSNYSIRGKYQEIFPHIVADHYQPCLGGISSTSGRTLVQPGEEGMPIVTSVTGNYKMTGST